MPGIEDHRFSEDGAADASASGPGCGRDGVVSGSCGSDLIDKRYIDGDGDRIDAGDAILRGARPDDDLVEAGAGNDTVHAGAGADEVLGGDGNDLITTGAEAPDRGYPGLFPADADPCDDRDTIDGGNGNDTIRSGDDADVLRGGAGRDLLDGGVDDDRLYGGSGNDTLIGGEGADVVKGGADADLILGGTAGDVVDGGEEGCDHDRLDLSHTGQAFVIHYDVHNHENGEVVFLDDEGKSTGKLTFRNVEEVVPCFTPGTLIATPKGEVPVEWLKPGDRVITRDNGIQEIRWVSAKPVDWAMLTAHPHLKPILIQQGSLGDGLPERDMQVSPNHRMLVANDRTALYFDEHEVLVAAKHLVAARGVQEIESVGTTYIHFMFDQHQVVLSNGAWSESFQPGDHSLRGVGNAQRNELFELFPELRSEEGLAAYTSARRTLRRHEARLLTR